MGSTLSLALNLFDSLIVAHVGDSPVYLFRKGQFLRLTRDHTVAEERGASNSYAARFRHILTRAIGVPGVGGEPDVACYRLVDGDRVMLCTDGLTEMVNEEWIARELAQGRSSDEACQALVDRALENGGKDNVTVVVATYHLPRAP
jgi:protein phosphatase